MKKKIGKSLIVIAVSLEAWYFFSMPWFVILSFFGFVIIVGLFLWLLWWLFNS
jgi:hypothetical protein